MPDELLEIRDASGALERIEKWLADRGLFSTGDESRVADVCLGYGLPQTIRRATSPWPPEPRPRFPLAACRLVERDLVTDRYKGSFEIAPWEPTWTAAERQAAVDEVRAAIASRAAFSSRACGTPRFPAPLPAHGPEVGP